MMHDILESKMLYEIKTRMIKKITELIYAVNISLDSSHNTNVLQTCSAQLSSTLTSMFASA